MTQEGRGYPNIESLKEIAHYFSITIDELLSGEKLLSIAEKENKSNIRNVCDWSLGIIDIFYVILLFLPLYPNTVDGYIYSVNLFMYDEITIFNQWIYWSMFITLILLGFIKILITKFKINKYQKVVTATSVIINILTVFIMTICREVYGVIVTFMLLIIKGIFLFKSIKL